MLLLVASTVTWRSATIFTGGFDLVVIAKGALSILVLLIAWSVRRHAYSPQSMGNVFIWLLIAYVVISTFGAWTQGMALVTGVVAVRLALVATTLVLLVKTFPPDQLIRDFFACLSAIALVAGITGLPSLAREGRLSGGLPQMHSNELSLLFALPAIWGLYVVLRNKTEWSQLLLLVTLLSGVVATGSRTALLMVVVGLLVMLPQARRLRRVTAVSLFLSVPGSFFVIAQTNAVEGFFNRQGGGSVATLNSRSFVWEAALEFPPTAWVRWMGTGLATKEIPVAGQYWTRQVLDSSWVSALVQAGLLGVLILIAWILLVVTFSTRADWRMRMLAHGVLAGLLFRSIFESGLMDSSPAFVAFALLSLALDKPSNEWQRGSVGLTESTAAP